NGLTQQQAPGARLFANFFATSARIFRQHVLCVAESLARWSLPVAVWSSQEWSPQCANSANPWHTVKCFVDNDLMGSVPLCQRVTRLGKKPPIWHILTHEIIRKMSELISPER